MMGIPTRTWLQIKDGATAGSLAMAGDFSARGLAAVQEFGRTSALRRASGPRPSAAGECPAGAFTNQLFEPCPSGTEPHLRRAVAYEVLLATGGNETTAQLLSNLVVLLAAQPGDPRAAARRARRCAPSAVEEVLRYISPVTGLFRHTTRRCRRGRHRAAGRGQGAAHVRLGQPRRARSTSVPTSS